MFFLPSGPDGGSFSSALDNPLLDLDMGCELTFLSGELDFEEGERRDELGSKLACLVLRYDNLEKASLISNNLLIYFFSFLVRLYKSGFPSFSP